MFYLVGWSLILCLVAFWSLGAWAFHAAAAWTLTNAGVLAGGSATGSLRLPDWLAPWVPPELAQSLTSMMASLAPAIESLVGWAPALANGLSGAIWVVWALGAALLVGIGLMLSAGTAALRRRSTRASNATVPARAVG